MKGILLFNNSLIVIYSVKYDLVCSGWLRAASEIQIERYQKSQYARTMDLDSEGSF